jgi:glycosyltransferase involved in cell wall biosynthesis
MKLFDVKSLSEVVFDNGRNTQADVAIVIPLYNYEYYILDCLKSVIDQTLDLISVVIIDDHSTDAGSGIAADFLGQHESRFCSARILRQKRNLGLSMTRNSGIVWTAEPLLFMLDADNRLRPPALARLKSALDFDGADFAYSQTFIFGDEVGVGPANVWRLDSLRFGNTIDAMALIRRSALLNAGGYAVLANDYGWEDYDLWCRFYKLGLRGVFVPELLCEYRRHEKSMTNISTRKNFDTLFAEMALRYPEIVNAGQD